MSKRVLFAGLAAVALSLCAGGSAQAQHRLYGNGFHNGGFARPVFVQPVFTPVVVGRPVLFNSINSPYFGFGNAGYPFNRPAFGGWGNGWGNGWGGGWGGRPGFSVGFGTILR